MRGLNQHLEFQIKLAGGKTGRGSGSNGGRSSDQRMPTWETVPDDIPDISSMVPVERG